MNKSNICDIFIQEFNEYEKDFIEHKEYFEETLPHVFFGNCLSEDIVKLLQENNNSSRLIRIFDFLERMYIHGDKYVREILSTTILARIGDDPDLLKIAYKLMGPNTRKCSDELEDFIERPRIE